MKIVGIQLVSDSIPEISDEAFQVILSSPTGGAGLSDDVADETIVRDDVAPANTVALVSTSVTAAETNGSASFTVARTGIGPITVNYTTAWKQSSGTSAQPLADYAQTYGVLIWGSGDTASKTITIPLVNDGIAEGTENLTLALFAAGGGAVLGSGMGTVTITDQPAMISVAATASVTETQTSVTLNVTRQGATAENVSVSYATSNGTATSGTDYSSSAGTLTWLATDPDIKTVTIPLINDAMFEGNETFTLTLSSPTGASALGTSSATVTITDDDPQPTTNTGGGGGGSLDPFMVLLLGLFVLARVAQVTRTGRGMT